MMKTNEHARSIYSTCPSPFGELFLISDGDALTGLHLPPHDDRAAPCPEPGWLRDDAHFRDVRDQLQAYFEGELHQFEIPIRLVGTEFQRSVWKELINIPFGTTISYAEQARRIGRAGSARAVGAANGRNPIAIVVPCHRVIGANGTLTGYGGGLELKQWLLDLETVAARHDKRSHSVKAKVATCLVME
jgi:methylated-DNA-[protein]-cysteine S-methyltransferase